MYIIDQDVANEIAKTQKMASPTMKQLFQMTEDEVQIQEQELRNRITEQTQDEQVARAVTALFPIYLEHQAITNYIRMARNPQLRAMMPEILTAEEASLIAQMEYHTDEEQTRKIREQMSSLLILFQGR